MNDNFLNGRTDCSRSDTPSSLLDRGDYFLEHEIYSRIAQDYAEESKLWARRSRTYANSIDLPAAMLMAIAINLLATCLLFTVVRG